LNRGLELSDEHDGETADTKGTGQETA